MILPGIYLELTSFLSFIHLFIMHLGRRGGLCSFSTATGICIHGLGHVNPGPAFVCYQDLDGGDDGVVDRKRHADGTTGEAFVRKLVTSWV